MRRTFSSGLHTLHLKIAFLIVGIDFQRLVFSGALFIKGILQSTEQSTEKVIAQGYLMSRFEQYFFSMQVEDAEGFIVDEKDGHRIVKSDDGFLYAVDNGFHVILGRLYFSQCAGMIVSQSFGHPVEVIGHFFKLFAF